jgi:hypothetical protein
LSSIHFNFQEVRAMSKKILLGVVLIATVVVLLSGCAGSTKYMREVDDSEANYIPAADEAVVVFMRPSVDGWGVQSVVHDATEVNNKLIGIVPAQKKLAYRTKPGRHLFMVTSEAADFMRAELEAGKIYYATVNPRIGWTVRFSLAAVHKDAEPEKLAQWKNGCKWVETTGETYVWALQRYNTFQELRKAYIDKWENKPDTAKPTLRPEDGFVP